MSEKEDIPLASPAPSAPGAAAAEAAVFCKLITEADGTEHWKLTCECGKRVRSPLHTEHPYGHCPRCNRRMKLPGYNYSKPMLVTAQPGKGPLAAPTRSANEALASDETLANSGMRATGGVRQSIAAAVTQLDERSETVQATPVPAHDNKFHHNSAEVTADRLRPNRPHRKPALINNSGRISAWPLAGRGHRALAAFIDLTFSTLAAGSVIVLARFEILPPFFLSVPAVLMTLFLAGLINDGLIHMIWGGSIGKSLVIIVTRTVDGEPLSGARAILRAMFKWMLFPGWIIGIVDPSQRTLHDLLCGTLVLKGRSRHR